MPTPTEVKSTTDAFVQNEDTLLATGNDGSTALKATSIVNLSKKVIWDGTAFQLAKQAVAGAITALTGIDSTLMLAQYLSTLPSLTDGNWRSLLLSFRGELITTFVDFVSSPASITAADTGSTSTTGQNNQTIVSGTPTTGSVVAITVSGDSSFSVKVGGTWVGTLQFERTLDAGSTWTPIAAFSAGTSYTGSQITANGSFHGNCSSSNGVRVRCLTLTSGSPSIQILAGAGTGTITIGNPLRLFDAVSGALFTIKPASTLPATTDTAIVVTQRDSLPNTAPTKRSGVSSGTANTFTQFIASNTARKSFFIHNPPTSGDILDLAVGVSVDVSATTNATTTLTSVAGFGLVVAGDWITGTGIPAGTYVVSVATTSSLTMSAAATNTATNTISFWSPYISIPPGDSVAVNTKADDLPTAAIYGRYQTNTNVRYTAWES